MNKSQKRKHKKLRDEAEKAPRHIIRTEGDKIALVPITQEPPKGSISMEVTKEFFDLLFSTPHNHWPSFSFVANAETTIDQLTKPNEMNEMNEMNTEEAIERVVQWGRDKGILDKATTMSQFHKMQEEVAELGEELEALARGEGDVEKAKMELGDVIVTAIIEAQLLGSTVLEVLSMAYHKIEKRTGTMVDGQFVRDKGGDHE